MHEQGERRMRRGDVKFLILGALEKRPMHGYDIMQYLEEEHQGRYRPSPGSVYPTLQMLEDGGFVSGEVVEGKRVYSITDAGRKLLQERRTDEDSAAQDHWKDVCDSGREFADAARKFGDAIRQGFAEIDPQVRERVRKVIDDARREIYTILSEK